MPIPAGSETSVAELATTLVATEDDRLRQAEAAVRNYCRWHIAPSRTETLSVDPSGSAALVLPTLHLTDVASVTIDGVVQDPADYRWSTAGVLTAKHGRWTERAEVVLTHGHDSAPPEVTAVVQAAARRAVVNPDSKPREQVGPFGDTYSQAGFNQAPALALLDAEKLILDNYKLPPRA